MTRPLAPWLPNASCCNTTDPAALCARCAAAVVFALNQAAAAAPAASARALVAKYPNMPYPPLDLGPTANEQVEDWHLQGMNWAVDPRRPHAAVTANSKPVIVPAEDDDDFHLRIDWSRRGTGR